MIFAKQIVQVVTMSLIASSVAFAEPFRLTYNWGTGKARVLETVKKDGGFYKISYLLDIKPNIEGYQVSFGQLKIVEVDGNTNIDPQVNLALSQNVILPDLLINYKGEPQRLYNYDDYIHTMANKLGSSPELLNILKSEQFKAALQLKSFEVWCSWSCTWNNINMQPRQIIDSTTTTNLLGVYFPMKIRYENKGFYGKTKLAHLQYTAKIEGDAYAKSKLDLALKSVRPDDVNKDSEALKIKTSSRFNKQIVVETALDPGTMRPVLLEKTQEISTEVEGKWSTRSDFHRYEFTWMPRSIAK